MEAVEGMDQKVCLRVFNEHKKSYIGDVALVEDCCNDCSNEGQLCQRLDSIFAKFVAAVANIELLGCLVKEAVLLGNDSLRLVKSSNHTDSSH